MKADLWESVKAIIFTKFEGISDSQSKNKKESRLRLWNMVIQSI